MTDLISRADAIEAVRNARAITGAYRINLAVEALKALPSADAVQADDRIEPNKIYCSPLIADNVVEVVRCKDCKYWRYNSNCNRWADDSHDQAYTNANDFCSYGEIKESVND